MKETNKEYTVHINYDVCINCNGCIDIAPRKCITRSHNKSGEPSHDIVSKSNAFAETTYIYIDNDLCDNCGKCIKICPVEALYKVLK